MTGVTMKPHVVTVTRESSVRWHQLVSRWLNSSVNLHNHWKKYRRSQAGHCIPYRVWLRHGAYLEMNKKMSHH